MDELIFKCSKCSRTTDQMKKDPTIPIDIEMLNEFLTGYPELDKKTAAMIYRCGCGKVNTYMNMVEC